MGDNQTLAKAKRELEEIYQGLPEDSLDLSFKDFASFQVHEKSIEMMPKPTHQSSKNLVAKSPSLDFSKGLRGAHSFKKSGMKAIAKLGHEVHDLAMAAAGGNFGEAGPFEEVGRRRQGIPHSNICALCSDYIYVFKTRCLVCGRVYCRHCLDAGMGEMTEGRKCIQCLGRRFSQRYISKAGQSGCCFWRYSSSVRQQELKWAEKGPRKSGEKQFGKSGMVSVSQYLRSSVVPAASTMSQLHGGRNSMASWSAARQVQGGRSRSSGMPVRSHDVDEPMSFISASGQFPSVHALPV